MSGNLRQADNIRVHVEAHRRLGVTQASSEFHGFDAALMPQGGAPVAERVRREPGAAHPLANAVAVSDLERQPFLERFQQEAGGVDRSADTLALRALSCEANAAAHDVHVGRLQAQGFRHTASELLHDEDGEPMGGRDVLEDAEYVVSVGWDGFGCYYSRQLHPAVAGDVRDAGEVEHHSELADEQADGAGLVLVRDLTDPGDDAADGDLVYRGVAELVEQNGGAEPIARQGALPHPAPRRHPFRVSMAKPHAALDAALQLGLRVLRRGEPLPDQRLADQRFLTGPERTSVLDLAVAAPAAVADVEASAVPGVSGAYVEGRQ